MLRIEWLIQAYINNFEQLQLFSSKEGGRVEFRQDGDLKIVEDEIKFNDADNTPFIPIKLIANEKELGAEFVITLPVNLTKTGEIDILKILARMNHKPGAYSYFFDSDVKKIKSYSYLNYFGSNEEEVLSNFEIMIFSNILYSAMIDANYWTSKISLLENHDFVAEDLFKLIANRK